MANTKRYGALGAQMSRAELIFGFLYLPFYVIVLQWLLGWLFKEFNLQLSAVTLNLVYFTTNFVIIVLILHRWLLASLADIGGHFWVFLQAVVLGFVFYYALSWACTFVLTLLGLGANPNDAFIGTLKGSNFTLTAICTVLLAPIVEESIFRGLIFSNLHLKSRALAYVISTLLFAVLHIWQFAGQIGWAQTLLVAMQYLPAGIALGWTYEKSGTIWAPIAVHALNNAIAIGVLHY